MAMFLLTDASPDEKSKRPRGKEKPLEFSYHKWAHLGVPMLISAADDTKLFAYSVKEFTKFSPHDICPAPQRVQIQLVQDTGLVMVAVSLYGTKFLYQYPESKTLRFCGQAQILNRTE